jgi:hypothetical protein
MNKKLARATLEALGYKDIPETPSGIVVGDRIRHVSHRYSEAYTKGTGTVLAIMRRENSTWEQDYGQPDIELLVQHDWRDSTEVTKWADYHCVRIGVEL